MAWFPRSDEDRRRGDVALLRALLGEYERLREGEAEAFESMLEQFAPEGDPLGRVRVLTERNKNVPRGREVAPAEVLRRLPKAPPGRTMT